MMGPRQVAQGALFYEFSIEDHVPDDHLLRQLDRFVDLSDIRRFLAPYYSSTGRPSIDPELMIRMLIVGYCFGIRSERRLCDEVHLNLAYRWFCRLDLADPVPDHSSFSKRQRCRVLCSPTSLQGSMACVGRRPGLLAYDQSLVQIGYIQRWRWESCVRKRSERRRDRL